MQNVNLDNIQKSLDSVKNKLEKVHFSIFTVIQGCATLNNQRANLDLLNAERLLIKDLQASISKSQEALLKSGLIIRDLEKSLKQELHY